MIVVDASVALAWVLPDNEENHRYSAAIAELGASGSELLIAPGVLYGELAYALLKRGRKLKWAPALVAEYSETIDYFSVRPIELPSPLASIVRFAQRHNLQGFDAFYVALALSSGARLATLDSGMKTGAASAGVELATA